MLAVWCVLRISYITVAVRLVPDIGVIFWAYPLTWTLAPGVRLLPAPHDAARPGGGAQQHLADVQS